MSTTTTVYVHLDPETADQMYVSPVGVADSIGVFLGGVTLIGTKAELIALANTTRDFCAALPLTDEEKDEELAALEDKQYEAQEQLADLVQIPGQLDLVEEAVA